MSALLRPGNKALFEAMLQRWQVIGNTVSDLTGPRFDLQTSRSTELLNQLAALPLDQLAG